VHYAVKGGGVLCEAEAAQRVLVRPKPRDKVWLDERFLPREKSGDGQILVWKENKDSKPHPGGGEFIHSSRRGKKSRPTHDEKKGKSKRRRGEPRDGQGGQNPHRAY